MSSSEQTAFIELQNVVFRRGQRIILDNFSLRIPQGKVAAIMGPSGVGKSTVLKLITGQLKPESGQVIVNGQRIDTLPARQLNQYRKTLGVMLQNSALFTDLNVYENVALPVYEHTGLAETIVRRLVLTKLHAVGLRGALDLYPRELSGGMARRVALARALVLDPELVLYDEPFTGLDPIAVATVNQLIGHVNHALGLTSVLVTHNVEQISKLVDMAVILVEGKVAASGSPEELTNDQSPAVRQFMNGLADGPVPFHYPARELSEDLLA